MWANGTEGRGYAVSDTSATVHRVHAVNYVPPSFSGTARVGETLTGDPGEWSKPLDWGLLYSWLRCEPDDPDSDHCESIMDGDKVYAGRNYKVQRADLGHTLRLEVLASHDWILTAARSEPSAVVPTDTPVNTVAPSIAGLQRLGEKLTANRGSWTAGQKIDYKHWWMRCNADGEECQTIDGSENDKTHTVGRDDLGHTLKLRVHASTKEGDAEGWSTATSRIEEQPPVALGNPSIAGTPRVDQVQTANLGVWTSALNVRFNLQWYRCAANGTGCVAIDGADGRTYRIRYADRGYRIKLVVTAVSDEGTGTASSAVTEVVTA